ncbi:trypsin-like serine protease [Kordiimonas lacus]|uniref:Trypsin n=1 Tax=Kordiimonas lacus TaxID=637679 RepID=A0A1G6ZJM4_9PROT|nr:trypsin-like serine protease [Kordiimonas lacus]SDE02818.1 Trypsin [Kordiimonas lacus]
MKYTVCLAAALVMALGTIANAEVRRHDKPAEAYQPEEAPGYLVDMRHEGSGILVAPNWVLSVAHNIFYDYHGKTLTIGDKDYVIQKLVFHPNWQEMPPELGQGDAAPLMTFLAGRTDLVLIKLSESVEGPEPIAIYNGNDEVAHEITVYGKGAKGDGITGEQMETKPARRLGYFRNVVDKADESWLYFDFDRPGADALELEGTTGSGDSGGPSVVVIDGKPYAFGLSSWRWYEGDLANFKGGVYGMTSVQQRLSRYRDWIEATIKADE